MNKYAGWIVVLSLILCGCSSKEKVEEGYQAKMIEKSMSGYVCAKETQDLNLYNQETQKIFYENGNHIDKGAIILSVYSESDKTMADEYAFKLKNLNKQIDQKKSELNKTKLTLEDEMFTEIDMLEKEISELLLLKDEYNYYLSRLNAKKNVKAKFDGQLIHDENSFVVLSNEKVIQSIVKETEVGRIQESDEYYLKNRENQSIGKISLLNIIPNDEKTLKGQIAYYTITFKINELNKDISLKENESVSVHYGDIYYLVPNNYILKKEGCLYVKTEGQELKEVKGIQKEGYFEIINGLNQDDKIFEFEEGTGE